MVRLLRLLHSLLLAAGLASLGLPPAVQAEVPLPKVPKAQKRVSETQGCVEPVEVMRKKHYEFLAHQRDDTLRRGIRTRKYSLEECINCHVPPPESGKLVRIESKEHFCNSCHSYAAVRIDCFQCHRDTPLPGKVSSHKAGSLLLGTTPPTMESLKLASEGDVR